MLNEVPITLVVKAPNQKVADQTVECALNWTVRKLKEHLARVYPSNPTENQQKIIYSGRLLQDDVILEDVLCQHGSAETVHTVHLVCSISSTDFNTSPSNSDLNIGHTSTSSDGLRNRRPLSSDLRQQEHDDTAQQTLQTPQSPPNGRSSVTTNNGAECLQFQTGAFPSAYYNTFTPSYLSSGALDMMSPLGHLYTAEQLRWMQQQQQAYAQYMSNYMQFFQQGAIAVGQPFGYAPPPPSLPGRAAQDQPADVAREPVQPQQPPVVRMNAQGGMVDDDDEEMERDWLDWFYVGVRFVLLMGILYFYSTPVRFFTTVVLILFIYCFQIGLFRVVGPRRQPAQPPVNPPDADPNAADDPDGTGPVEPGALEHEEPRQPRGFALAWSVFLSFFASLAPQPPGQVDAN